MKQVVEGFDQRKMGAQPAAIEPAKVVGHGEKTDDEGQHRQNAAPHNGPRGLHCRGFAAHEGLYAQRPTKAKHPQLCLGEVKAQQVECGGEQKYSKKDRLKPAAAALQLCGGGQRHRGAVA